MSETLSHEKIWKQTSAKVFPQWQCLSRFWIAKKTHKNSTPEKPPQPSKSQTTKLPSVVSSNILSKERSRPLKWQFKSEVRWIASWLYLSHSIFSSGRLKVGKYWSESFSVYISVGLYTLIVQTSECLRGRQIV